MKYFIDTEYVWYWSIGQVWPISIGIVAENGLEYYAVSNAFSPDDCTQFVRDHVLPMLGTDTIPRPMPQIAAEIRSFIGPHTPEFWGDYSAFDYVVLSMLMGDFSDWPESWPMHVNDLQQEAILSHESKTPHNALADARAVRDAYDWAFLQKDNTSPDDEIDPVPEQPEGWPVGEASRAEPDPLQAPATPQ